jgi:hypothetical protein
MKTLQYRLRYCWFRLVDMKTLRYRWLRFRSLVYGLTHTRCRQCGKRKGLSAHSRCYGCQWDNLMQFLKEDDPEKED